MVYHVHDAETDTDIALKTLPVRTPDQLYYLKQEFRVLSGIAHPNLVELYELFVDADAGFFTMELVDGIDFARFAGAASLETILDTTVQLTNALAAVHAAGKLHRDVKPPNILVTPQGRAVLLDFGLATALQLDGTYDESGPSGTIAYMAPEVLSRAAPSPAGDWYSVGVILFEALVGRLPFAGPAVRMWQEKLRPLPVDVQQLAPAVPAQVASLITRLLDPDPERRPQGGEILRVLRPDAPAATVTQRLRSPSPPFLGRTAELRQLGEILSSVAGGETQVVRVRGPSGIGKTELVERFLTTVQSAGTATVLRGRCHPYEAIPYKALDRLIDLLSRVLLNLPEQEVAALAPAHLSMLLQLFPVLARVPALGIAAAPQTAAEPQEMRRQGFAALRELFGRLAARRPLVVWIDDLQWGDDDSAALLRELVRPPDAPVMLLVLSYRDESEPQTGPIDPGSDILGKGAGVATHDLLLQPLDTNDAHELARQLGGAEADSEQRLAQIVSESGGSPFFLAELARFAGQARGGGSLRLSDVVFDRVQHLTAPARHLMEMVSIAGGALPRSVALAAAGIGERGRPLVAALEQRCLLRTATSSDGIAVEVYHDRVRETLVERLSPHTQRDRHGELADVLEAQPAPDPDALFRHCLGAGRQERAGEWAVSAAQRAAHAFAFARAAELYGRARELKSWSDDESARLQLQEADAWANAGHGSSAAPLYGALARATAGVAGIEHYRRAAEQYLISGRMDQGVAELHTLLTAVNCRHPRSHAWALGASVARLLRLFARNFRPASKTTPSATHLIQIDALHAAAKGFIMVDPVLAMYFAVYSLDLALRRGTTHQAGRALTGVGAALLPAGGAPSRWARKMIAISRELAETEGDWYLRGFVEIGLAQQCMVDGQWRLMLESCDAGMRLLREHCHGVGWELDLGQLAALRALEELGDINEMRRRSALLRRDAEERHDIYGTVVGWQNEGVCSLLTGDPDEAREYAERIRESWTGRGYQMPHFYLLRLLAYADLAAERPEAAWQRVDKDWKAIEKSGLLRHALLCCDAHLLRARTALGYAAKNGSEDLRRMAGKDADRLGRFARADSRGYADVIRATLAAQRGDVSKMDDYLATAEQQFEHAEMKLAGSLVRMQRCLATGSPIEPRAVEYLRTQNVRNPLCLLRMLTAGLPEPAGL